MERIMLTLLSVVLSTVLSFGARNSDNPVLSRVKWDIESISMEVVNDSAVVTYAFTLVEDKIAKGYSVIIMPSLECGSDFVPLKPFSIYRTDDKAYRNKLKSQNNTVSGDPDEIYMVSGQYHGIVKMKAVVPRMQWMDSCSVYFSVMERSKKAEFNNIDRHIVATLKKPACPEYSPTFDITIPEPSAAGSVRTVVVPLALEFDKNSTNFEVRQGGNQLAVDEFSTDVEKLLKSRFCTFKSGMLRSWSSPEGTEKTNLSVSKGRAGSVYNFLRKKGTFCGKTVSSQGMGEDWDGMIEWLSKSSFSQEPGLLDMLEQNIPHDDIEKQFRNEKSRVWEILEQDCFPALRRFDLVLNLEPVDFDNKVILKAVYEQEPRLLTSFDFWRLSRLFPETSTEWCNVFLTAAEMFPDDEVCNMNAAAAMLATGSYRDASFYLNRAGDTDTAKYLRAVWMLGTDRLDSAIDVMKGLVNSDNRVYSAAFSKLVGIKNWVEDRVLWDVILIAM